MSGSSNDNKANGDNVDKEVGGSLLSTVDTKNPDGDDICGLRCRSKDVSCGCLQPFAKAKWTLAFFSGSNFLRQALLNGLIAVTISTLEKRFELRSTESGLIASMADFGLGICLVLLMFVPPRVDKPQIMGWGLVIAGLAMIMFAVPHFTAPEYTPRFENVSNYCGNVTEPDCSQSTLRNYLYWFIACFTLTGIGVCPFVVYSITYLDENVKKKVSTLYNAIYMSFGGLGPAIGFVTGGMSLELYTYIMTNPDDLGIDHNSYSWVGAWWIGYVVFGILLVVSAVPVLLLPKYLPGTDEYRKDRDSETQRSHLKSSTVNDKSSSVSGKLSEIFHLVQNKPYILMTFGLTMNCALVYGFNTFGTKYLESVFGLTPFVASLLFGFAGGTVPYQKSNQAMSIYSSCNINCSCSTDRFEPVCANGIAFYSPCFAGCEVKLNETSYTNCSCVGTGFDGGFASSETCDWKSCNLIIPFIFIIFICFFSSILTMPTAIQVILRCVPFKKRDMAMSLQFAIRHLIGVVPGRLFVGYVLDQACVAWSTECGQQGSCKVYNRWDIAKYNTILLIAQTVICVMSYILVFITYKPVGECSTDTTELQAAQNE